MAGSIICSASSAGAAEFRVESVGTGERLQTSAAHEFAGRFVIASNEYVLVNADAVLHGRRQARFGFDLGEDFLLFALHLLGGSGKFFRLLAVRSNEEIGVLHEPVCQRNIARLWNVGRVQVTHSKHRCCFLEGFAIDFHHVVQRVRQSECVGKQPIDAGSNDAGAGRLHHVHEPRNQHPRPA